jgi:REP element-mobilizing transposase RayT
LLQIKTPKNMDEEARRRRKFFAGDKKDSMTRRMEGHDYQARCIYLITMVTEGRQPLFGDVVGDVHQPYGYPDAPRTVPSALGEAIIANWQGMLARFPEMAGIAFQLMPDHFHAILFVTDHLLYHIGNILNGFKAGCRHSFHVLHPVLYDAAVQRQHPDAHRRDRDHGILFAPKYNDKVLLREGQLDNWIRYLADNPRRLLVKREHPEFFRVQRSLTWKGMTFSALGNRFLLRKPFLVQIQCSRSLTTEQIETKKNGALDLCRQGAVLVSPSISPGEKAIMRAAFAEGFPEIILKDNGFAPLTKPAGKSFDACARGQLLFLGPTYHSNEHKAISRLHCLGLNEIAGRLCL